MGNSRKRHARLNFFHEFTRRLCAVARHRQTKHAAVIERATEILAESHSIVRAEYLARGGLDPFSMIYRYLFAAIEALLRYLPFF